MFRRSLPFRLTHSLEKTGARSPISARPGFQPPLQWAPEPLQIDLACRPVRYAPAMLEAHSFPYRNTHAQHTSAQCQRPEERVFRSSHFQPKNSEKTAHSIVLSVNQRQMAITSTKPNTTSVVCPASWRVGQTTLRTSRQESLVKPINSLPAGENSATPPPAINPPASEAVRINAP